MRIDPLRARRGQAELGTPITRRPRRLEHDLHQRMHPRSAMHLYQRPPFTYPLSPSSHFQIDGVHVPQKRHAKPGSVLP
jgi:hypothetical protein